MPDTWRCECGYTNLNSKTCLVCRRPRQAVTPRTLDVVEEEPLLEEETPKERPVRARPSPSKKRPVRKKSE